MISRAGAVLLLGLGCHLSAGAQQCGSVCGDVLKFAPFNTSNTQKNNRTTDSFKKLLCAASWSSAEEAQAAGIDATIPIYEIAVPIAANWSNAKRDEWKSSNCSLEERNANYTAAVTIALRDVDPNVVPAWSQCIQTNCSPQALACSVDLTGNVATLKLRWLQGMAEPLSGAPEVLNFQSFGMTCSKALKPKSKISAAGTPVACKVKNLDESNVFVVSTSRGACIQSVATDNYDRVISGTQKLVSPTQIEAKRILFKSDATIITDGNDLSLKADRIDIEGLPRIVSFTNDRVGRPPGDNGRPGGRLLIEAKELRGSTLRIENFGENGTQGATGGKGVTGGKGRTGGGRNMTFLGGCSGGSDGDQGGVGGPGLSGGEGGTGGAGGSVTYAVGTGLGSSTIKRLDIIQQRVDLESQLVACNGSCGGLPGSGGSGGTGGDGGLGGDGAGPNEGCGGTNTGRGGPEGPTGTPGSKGRLGDPGNISVETFTHQ